VSDGFNGPELGHKKFQERLPGAFRMQENLSAAAASPRTLLSLSIGTLGLAPDRK